MIATVMLIVAVLLPLLLEQQKQLVLSPFLIFNPRNTRFKYSWMGT